MHPGLRKECNMNPGCVALNLTGPNACCPNEQGIMLDCCGSGAAPPVPLQPHPLPFKNRRDTMAMENGKSVKTCYLGAVPKGSQKDARDNKCDTSKDASTPEATDDGMTVLRTTQNRCNYVAASTDKDGGGWCDVKIRDIRQVDFDARSQGCHGEASHNASDWLSVFLYETGTGRWDTFREVDFIETNKALPTDEGDGDAVRTNWAGHGQQKMWKGYSQHDTWRAHVTAHFVPTATFDDADIPDSYKLAQGGDVRKVMVKHCEYGKGPCSLDPSDPSECSKPDVACRTFKFSQDAQAKFVANIWQGIPACEMAISPIKIAFGA